MALIRSGSVYEFSIRNLSSQGDGVGQLDDSLCVFVANTVPGDRIKARITQVKKTFAKAELLEVIEPSANRVRPPCIVADKCGGCQWLSVNYQTQLSVKHDLVVQALQRIGKFDSPEVKEIIPADEPLGYRNKVSYPLAWSDDGRRVKAGYFQRGTHKLINLNECPTQDQTLNPFLKEIKQDIEDMGWSIYDENKHRGHLRNLSFRVGRRTAEVMLTLVSTTLELPNLYEKANQWLEKYDDLASVNVNINEEKTNRIFGTKTKVLAGKPFLKEKFMGLDFLIKPTTFFQVFTEQAEAIVSRMLDALALSGTEVVIDAYSGVGTITLPMAQKVESVLGIEVQPSSIKQAKENARINNIRNARFKAGRVADVLSEISLAPDVLVLDPPRKGCDKAVIDAIKRLRPSKIMYLSCNPATLSRDLQLLCSENSYHLNWVQPVDFFPQTSHAEALAFLQI